MPAGVADRGRKGPPNDELFLESPSTPSAPPVEPLRINKRSSGSSQANMPVGSSSTPPPQAGAYRHPQDYPSEHPNLPYPDRPAAERMAQHQQETLGLPYDATSTAAAGSVGRHVSVVHSDAYPTPPAFRHREGGRPARLRAESRPSGTPSPPQQQHPYRPPSPQQESSPYPQFHQQYWPPPSRMTSTSTTAGRRGSPPPPQTPLTATTEEPPFRMAPPRSSTMPIPSASPEFSRQKRPPPVLTETPSPETPTPPVRPWTPTEQPGSYPHGPPTVWHGTGGQNSEENLSRRENSNGTNSGRASRSSNHGRSSTISSHGRTVSVHEQAPEVLEQDFRRMNMSSSPPPSYASLNHSSGRRSASTTGSTATTAQGYPDEKRTVVIGAAAPEMPPTSSHPAFQRDSVIASQQAQSQSPSNGQQQPHPQLPQLPQPLQVHPTAAIHQPQSQEQQQPQQQPQDQGAEPGVPPPLPEGWIAHLDASSGAYYYIHVATSHTQWDPPALDAAPPGGTPQASLALPHPHGQPVATPGFPPATPGFPPATPGFPPATPGFPPPTPGFPSSIASPGFPPKMDPYSSMPPTPGFGQFPPPAPIPGAGIVMYNPTPVNGEFFGPYLRYTNMDIDRGLWKGSIMLVTEYHQPPTIHIHRSRDLSPNPPQLKAIPIYNHRTWTFFKYEIELPMETGEMWTYAISTPVGCTRYEFLVAGRDDRNWRFISHSCNDFGLNVKGEERTRLGGHGFMWKDLMQKHLDCGGFHAQIGVGNQIYADRMWREVPVLKEWLQIRGRDNRRNAQWTTKHDEETMHAYFHYYTSSWDQPHMREAFAQIPYLFQLDDHDIFDGFGSHPEHLQFSAVFKNIGRIGMHWYLLFQHHATVEMLQEKPDDHDLFTITGTGWHWIKYMGPTVAVVGLDTRSERNQHQVMAGPTYQGIFPKIATLPTSIQHAILVISVPVVYPRMDTAEHVVATAQAGKKAVTGAYNVLGKLAGSAAGVLGAKEVVGSGFQSVKKAVGKHGLMGSVVNVFGEVELLDDIRDHWTHDSKDLERTYLIRTLQGISHQRGIRMSFLSGAVHVCGAGLVHDPNRPVDHKTMFQVICGAMVDAPPGNYLLKMLHNNRILYIPQNGLRSNNAPSDTKEDMMELFTAEVDGRVREHKKLMAKRGYAIFTAFEAEKGTSLAVDFMVQGEGVYAQTGKYGPVVVPRLEMGY